jgi:4-hydroxy-tetrahydrodipicolinate reductase
MNILILGYGKMGRAIEQVAVSRGHTIAARITIDNVEELNQVDASLVDVAIEFSSPEAAVNNLVYCFNQGIPVVCGTTGWLSHKKEVEQICSQRGGALFYASNFSLGVNLFFHLNRKLAELMNRYSMYAVSMEEVHHTEKKDAPSGTAITLADDIVQQISRLHTWVNHPAEDSGELTILSKREGQVPGTHIVRYDSPVDSIEIKHTAHSREGFALGAVVAAEWLPGKKGTFGMADMLQV